MSMNRPDEIAALADAKASLADHVASFWKLLETETVHLAVNIRMEIGHEAPDGPTVYYDCSTFSDDVAKELVRLSATSPGDAVREAWQTARKYVSSHADAAGAAAAIIAMEAALAPAEKAGNDLHPSHDVRGIHGSIFCTVCNGVDDELVTPCATPTPPSADVARALKIAFVEKTMHHPAGQYTDKLDHVFEAMAASIIQSAAQGGGTEGGEA